jgi:mono/diheme cytochrome c family protein
MKNIAKMKKGKRLFTDWMRVGTAVGIVVLLSACSKSGHDRMGAGQNLKMGEHWFSAEQVAQGEKIYSQSCINCHGYKGKAHFNWRQRLPDGSFPPPPLNGSAHSWHHSYANLLDQIANGGLGRGGKMPPFKNVLTEDQRVSVLAYIQSLWGDDIYQRWQMGGKHTM